jgi:hypothetical protein
VACSSRGETETIRFVVPVSQRTAYKTNGVQAPDRYTALVLSGFSRSGVDRFATGAPTCAGGAGTPPAVQQPTACPAHQGANLTARRHSCGGTNSPESWAHRSIPCTLAAFGERVKVPKGCMQPRAWQPDRSPHLRKPHNSSHAKQSQRVESATRARKPKIAMGSVSRTGDKIRGDAVTWVGRGGHVARSSRQMGIPQLRASLNSTTTGSNNAGESR